MSIKQAIEALELALPIMEEQATIQGYGFYRPANPNDFSPDPESCTEEEIANHRAACKAYDEGKFVPDTSDGWVSPNLHILKAPWGIGSYTETIPELQAQCDKTRAALAALRSMPAEPVDDFDRKVLLMEDAIAESHKKYKLPSSRAAFQMGVHFAYRALATPHTAPLSDAEIEKLALEHEAFGFGQVDAQGFTTHGFDPDGMCNFARAIERAVLGRGREAVNDHEVERMIGYTPCVCGNLDGTWHPECYRGKSKADIDAGYKKVFAKARRYIKAKYKQAAAAALAGESQV